MWHDAHGMWDELWIEREVLAHELLHGGVVGAQGARLHDLPLIAGVLSELNRLAFSLELDTGELVRVKGQQPLIP